MTRHDITCPLIVRPLRQHSFDPVSEDSIYNHVEDSGIERVTMGRPTKALKRCAVSSPGPGDHSKSTPVTSEEADGPHAHSICRQYVKILVSIHRVIDLMNI